MHRYVFIAVAATALLTLVAASGVTRTRADDFVVSDMRVQEFPAITYAYSQHRTSFPELAGVVEGAMEQMMGAILAGDMQPQGAPIFIYSGVTGMDQPFDIQIGFPVADGANVDGDIKVRDLAPYRCATVLYSGSMFTMGEAYQRLFADINEAGLVPAGDHREMHLYFENVESPNNVVLIQIGVR